jgi:hypothetical protein
MGRWSSDSFMRYIRKQILFTKIITFEQFYIVPDFVHNATGGDTRSRSNTNLAITTNFIGSHANMLRGLHPVFQQSH